MDHVFERHLDAECTITRRSKTGENDLGEPIYGDTTTVVSGVACHLEDRGTEFVREDSGERVNRPATVRLPAETDVQEGDTLDIDGEPTDYEVRGLERHRDHRHDVVGITATVERVD